MKNIVVFVGADNTITTKTMPSAQQAFTACQIEWAAQRPALYCDETNLESTKAEVARRWAEGWKSSTQPATVQTAAPVEQPKPVLTKKASVQLVINFSASYDAGHPEKAIAHWTVDLSTIGGAKELTGTMIGADGTRVTDDSVTLTALLAGLRALKRPCEVDVIYPRKGKALHTIEAIIKRGFKTAQNKEPANIGLIKEIAPLLEQHDCIFVMR